MVLRVIIKKKRSSYIYSYPMMPFRHTVFSLLCLCFCAGLQSQVSSVSGERPLSSLHQPARTGCAGPGGEQYACEPGRDSLIFFKGSLPGKAVAPLKRPLTYARPFMAMACDTSQSPYRGRIYICWSDEKNGASNADVFLVYSEDDGKSWTEPVLVTYRPNHKPQFDPAMAVDGLGRVYLSYFDAQNALRGGNDLYLARSTNGGLLFTYYQLDLLPPGMEVINLGISNKNSRMELHWGMALKNRSLLEYSAVLSDSLLDRLLMRKNSHVPITHQKTVEFADKIYFPFTLSETLKLDAAITRPLEPGFEKVLIRQKKFKKGTHTLLINTKKLGLEKGSYILTLYGEGKNSYAWILAE